jgi:hypothetical protein
MKCKLAVLAVLLLLGGSTVFAASTYYLPQVAIGTDSGSGDSYSTTFVLFNNNTEATNISVVLTDYNGDPMKAYIAGVGSKNGAFSLRLGPGATRIYKTDSYGSLNIGAASITSDLDIGVSGLYTITKRNTGKFVTEVGVASATPGTSFAIPAEFTGDGFVGTAVAVYNPNGSPASVNLTLMKENGDTQGSTSTPITLDAGKQSAFFIDQKIASIQNSNFKGMCKITSDTPIALMTLRMNSPGFATYTSIPAISTGSSDKTFYLPQFADGSIAGTPYKTTFLLFNFSNSQASVKLEPKDHNGNALTLSMTDGSSTAADISIAAGASKFLQTDGTSGSLGGAKITSTVPIGAAALFTQYNTNLSFATEAGVLPSRTLTNFTLPIDSTVSLDGSATTSDTGFAFYNPGSSVVSFSPVFLSNTGAITTSQTQVTLNPNSHYQSFFNQVFPNLGDVQGSVQVSGLSDGISAITLRMNMTPFNMTTLPIVSGVSTGYAAATSGTATKTTVAGAIATADTTVNAILPFGYTVTFTTAGTFTGGSPWSQYGGLGIRSLSAGYTYTTNSANNAYLPPGDYEFSVHVLATGGGQTSANYAFYTTDMVSITGNATIPITYAFPTLYTVSGNITGVTSTAGKVILTSADGSGSYAYNGLTASGPYSIKIQSGTYQLMYASTWPGGPFYTLGTVTVSDADTTGPDVAVPTTANLSGQVHFADAAPASVTINAQNRDNITPPGVASDVRTVTAANGAYQNLQVTPTSVNYSMNLSYTTGSKTPAVGINCGGTADSGFSAEQYSSTGTSITNTTAVSVANLTDGTPASVLQAYRYSPRATPLVYTIPNLTPNAEYNITLYFVDSMSATAVRFMKGTANDTVVFESLDVKTEAGGQYIAVARSATAVANSAGQMVITVSDAGGTTATNIYINAIRITPVDPNSAGLAFTTNLGTVNYTPANNPVTFAGDFTYDFTMPGILAYPLSFVTISGKVSDPGGAAVSGATVTATSSLLADATAPTVSYTSNTATTDASGNYSLKVIPGANYSITITKAP